VEERGAGEAKRGRDARRGDGEEYVRDDEKRDEEVVKLNNGSAGELLSLNNC
jgi:hypothetical protein